MNQKLIPGVVLSLVWCWFLFGSEQSPVFLFFVLSLSVVSGFLCLSYIGSEIVAVFSASPLAARGRVMTYAVCALLGGLILSVVELSSKSPYQAIFAFLFKGVAVEEGGRVVLFFLSSATSAVVLSVVLGFTSRHSAARTIVRALVFCFVLLSVVPVTGFVPFCLLALFGGKELEPSRFSWLVVSLLGAIRLALHFHLFVGSVLIWPAALLVGISLCRSCTESLKEAPNAG